MNMNQVSKQAEIDKLQAATGNTEVRSEIYGIIQKIDTSKLGSKDGDTLDDSMGADYGSSVLLTIPLSQFSVPVNTRLREW